MAQKIDQKYPTSLTEKKVPNPNVRNMDQIRGVLKVSTNVMNTTNLNVIRVLIVPMMSCDIIYECYSMMCP